jgi:hypothetical protein
LHPQSATGFTGAGGTIEGEQRRLDIPKGRTARRTGRPHRKDQVLALALTRQRDLALADFECCLERALEPALRFRFYHQAIDDHRQALGRGDLCGTDFFQQVVLAIDPQPAVARAIDPGQKILWRLVRL